MKVHLIDSKLAAEMDDYPAIPFQLDILGKSSRMYRMTS